MKLEKAVDHGGHGEKQGITAQSPLTRQMGPQIKAS
jgi:hypothetical protein